MEITLLPDNYKEIFHDFDDTRGYARNLELSRRHFQREADAAHGPLTETGVEKFSVLTNREAVSFCRQTDQSLHQWTDKDAVIPVLERVFTAEVDARLLAYFESEYLPTTVSFTRSDVIRDDESCRWHCDGGPSTHLVMMLYFTSSEVDGSGNTHFLDRAITDKLKEAGYVFCPIESRLGDDMMPILAENFGVDFQPHKFDIRAGEMVVFDAPNILHRGAYPKITPRYTMTVSLVPSPVHWRSALEKTDFPRRSELSESYPPVDWKLI